MNGSEQNRDMIGAGISYEERAPSLMENINTETSDFRAKNPEPTFFPQLP